ncbi:MAG TPA: cupin domain-containing protein [Nocardioidaceae bacterium]|nr:cupin domain-containing protein [Nocardioidaceae bacterium]
MSYPAPRYLGETGEASGTFRPADTATDLRFAGGGGAHYLATGALTGGQFGLYRWDMAGEPTGPGPHFHRTMTESFFVLSGAVRLYDGQGWRDGHPDDFFFVPEGGVHGFRNESGEPASMLILFTPGAPREAYFEGLAALATADPKPGKEQLDEFFLQHDNHWV